MKNLTYSICYSPSSVKESNSIDYICADNRVHVRFRDYVEEEVINGFEKKLTYLITYLMNYSYLPKILKEYDDKTLINDFLKTSDLLQIYSCIRLYCTGSKFRGLKLRKNYRKTACKPFGEVNENIFPLNAEEQVSKAVSLDTFLKSFRINLHEYLFNDAYSIIIHKKSNVDMNKKFINKENKRINFDVDSDLVKLW